MASDIKRTGFTYNYSPLLGGKLKDYAKLAKYAGEHMDGDLDYILLHVGAIEFRAYPKFYDRGDLVEIEINIAQIVHYFSENGLICDEESNCSVFVRGKVSGDTSKDEAWARAWDYAVQFARFLEQKNN